MSLKALLTKRTTKAVGDELPGIFARTLSAAETSAIEKLRKSAPADADLDTLTANAMIRYGVVDAQGEPIFDDADVPNIADSLDAAKFLKLVETVTALNEVSGAGIDDAKKPSKRKS
jgi:hypothetical protein